MKSATESNQRKITVMIYMCGSNLESKNGAATSDMVEILKSRYDTEQISVIAMAGGTTKWWNGFSADETAIYDISGTGPTQVYAAETMNMGEASTLQTLLDFGYNNYPAEKFALILWDHGGGPMQGVCWDSLAYGDNLTMLELKTGLQESPFAREPLEWIGFDACLMSSAETAYLVSPYAKYMIASQETEPGSGWNYAFMNGLEADANGGETGRRIIDSYYDDTNQKMQGKADLTLACLDLSRCGELESAMDDFFGDLTLDLSRETFSALSNMRQGTRGFGRSDKENQDFDLVDLVDLIEHYENQAPEKGEKLLNVLQSMILYNRTNLDNSNGLSVYHPFYNKTFYQNGIEELYMSYLFAPGYLQYIRSFAEYWLGEELGDWRRMASLIHEETTSEEDSAVGIELTQEQLQTYGSSKLLVLEERGLEENRYYNQVFLTDQVELDETGKLTASYNGEGLYLVDEDGNAATEMLEYYVDDGKYWIPVNYIADDSTVTHTIISCKKKADGEPLEQLTQYVWDEATGMYTNRLTIDPSDYAEMSIPAFNRVKTYEGEQLLEFSKWDLSSVFSPRADYLDPSYNWNFQFMDQQTGADLYACFQIADTQGNVHSSDLIRLENPNVTSIPIRQNSFEGENYRIEAEGYRIRTNVNPGLEFDFKVENKSDNTLKLRANIGDILINDHIILAGRSMWFEAEKGCSDEYVLKIGENDLTNVEELESLTVYLQGDDEQVFRFEMQENEHIEELAEKVTELNTAYEDSSEKYELYNLHEDEEGNICGILYYENLTDDRTQELFFDEVKINSYILKLYRTISETVRPKTSVYVEFKAENTIYNTSGWRSENDPLNLENYLGRCNVKEIKEISFQYSGTGKKKISFSMEQPFPYEDRGTGEEEQGEMILQLGSITMKLDKVVIDKNQIELRILVDNSGSKYQTTTLYEPKINGKKAKVKDGLFESGSCEWKASGNMTSVYFASFRREDDEDLSASLGDAISRDVDAFSVVGKVNDEDKENSKEASLHVPLESFEFAVFVTGKEHEERFYQVSINPKSAYLSTTDSYVVPLSEIDLQCVDIEEGMEAKPIFASEVSVPENSSEMKKKFEIDLSGENPKDIKSVCADVVMIWTEKNEDEEDEPPENLPPCYNLLARVDMTEEKNEIFIGNYSGLVLRQKGNEEFYIFNSMREMWKSDGRQVTLSSVTGGRLRPKKQYQYAMESFYDLPLNYTVDFEVEIDCDNETATVTKSMVDDHLRDLKNVAWPIMRFESYSKKGYAVSYQQNMDGTCEIFTSDEGYNWGESYECTYELQDQPIELSLVPVTEVSDQLFVRYIITYKDGSQKRLGFFPYNEM